MSNVKYTLCAFLLSATSMFAVSCGDDAPKTADASVDSTDIDAEGCVCDPVGTLPMQAALANVPLATGVEVVVREGRHPGCAGPAGLP